jgi:hypothetical protein
MFTLASVAIVGDEVASMEQEDLGLTHKPCQGE